jgi:hypothetical protein
MEAKGMSLTGTHIAEALKAVGAGSRLIATPDQIADMFNQAIFSYGQELFTSDDRVAALVSQSMMESDYFRTTEEYAKDGRYKPYIGRTFIQITWKSNYLLFGKFCLEQGLISDENYFVDNPHLLADIRWAAIGPVWYFTRVLFNGKPLVEYSSDVDAVGKAVNLGSPTSPNLPNGYKARRTAYAAVLALGDLVTPPPLPSPPVEEEVEDDINEETKEAIMAVGKYIKFWNNTNQSLKVGEQYVKINSEGGVSTIVGQNPGVQLIGVVEIDNPGGYPIHGFWRIVDWVKGGPYTNRSNGLPIPAVFSGTDRGVVQATFFGPIPKQSRAGRSMRLRFVIRVGKLDVPDGEKAPKLPIINNVHIEGWKL